MESLQQSDLVFSTEFYDAKLIEEEETEYLLRDTIAFAASNDPYMLYYHQTIKRPDEEVFIKAIVKEINGRIKGEYWELVKKSEALKGSKRLDSVWTLKCKRDIKNL
eukprot:4769811-Ditylum_brightwellii.AAC.1